MTWSSFEKDKLLVEGWRSFLTEEKQQVFGLNSKKNPDSLINILNKLAGFLTPEQKITIVNLVADGASDEDIMLEAVTLQGAKSEKDRVFSGETSREIIQGIAKLELDAQKMKAVVKALNYWGKVNTIKFEKPEAPAAVTPVEVPDEENTGEPSPEEVAAPSDPDSAPTLDFLDDEAAAELDALEAEEIKAKERAEEATPAEVEQKKKELKQQVQILRQKDDPDKGFLGLIRNNPLNFMFNIPSNIVDGLITVYNLEPEQRTKGNLSKVVIQEIFDIGDSVAFDLLPDNTPYLLKERQFKQLFTGILTNITTKGEKALVAAEKLCKLCKGAIAGQAVISKIPKIGGLVVALAKAIAVIACPIAKIAPKLRPLLTGDASGFSENPFFTAGLSGKFVDIKNNKLVIFDRQGENTGTVKRSAVNRVVSKIESTDLTNKQDAEMYILGLKSYASILSGFEKIDTSEILADEPEEAETEPITPAAPAALQESKQVIRWKQLAGIS